MGINGGRSRKGEEETGYIRLQITVPPSINERLDRYREAEDLPRSWVIQKALDEWLKKRDY